MKLRQIEYCHNCDQHVVFEFDDITERQVIICPNCEHAHYRELDQGTILNIQLDQMHGTRGSQLRVAKMPKIPFHRVFTDNPDDMLKPLDIVVETYDVVGRSKDGRAIVKAKPGEATVKTISNRRWGRDPRQG